MKPNKLILLAVAAGCGLVAMLGVQQMMSGNKAATAKTNILIAKAEIGPGMPLDKSNVGFKEWPIDSLPEGAITKEEEFAERSLKHRVGPGQPILVTELGKKGDFGLEVQIPEGMTVQTMPVNGTQTHSGLLKPGAYVDVSAAIEYALKNGQKELRIQPVLQCLKVIAVDDQIAGTESAPTAAGGTAKEAKNVSFLVFPIQGKLLQLAFKKSNGSIQLALRGKTDKTLADAGDLTEEAMTMLSNQMLGDAEEPTSSKSISTVSSTLTSTPSTSKPKSAIRRLVKGETNPAVSEVGDQPSKQIWKIEIFQGDKREVQEISLPDEPTPVKLPSSLNATQSWSIPLLKLFTSDTKPEAKQSGESGSEPKPTLKQRSSKRPTSSPETNDTPTSTSAEPVTAEPITVQP
ncbi:MAG: Flp pilus assembly protein CpaB [Planctomycetales bacterium]|nr:Flp pilus assembly protein CpaB [Planctomycetales bacterium]